MLNFIHRLFNPHCEHCIEELKDARHCNSCEVLQQQLNTLIRERDMLLEKLLKQLPNENEPIKNESNEKVEIRPRNIPWRVQRQMLEAEDRHKAKLMREAPKPDSIEELEKEVLG